MEEKELSETRGGDELASSLLPSDDLSPSFALQPFHCPRRHPSFAMRAGINLRSHPSQNSEAHRVEVVAMSGPGRREGRAQQRRAALVKFQEGSRGIQAWSSS